jgi:hypothetical protein
MALVDWVGPRQAKPGPPADSCGDQEQHKFTAINSIIQVATFETSCVQNTHDLMVGDQLSLWVVDGSILRIN